jgi:hypothetical protein
MLHIGLPADSHAFNVADSIIPLDIKMSNVSFKVEDESHAVVKTKDKESETIEEQGANKARALSNKE